MNGVSYKCRNPHCGHAFETGERLERRCPRCGSLLTVHVNRSGDPRSRQPSVASLVAAFNQIDQAKTALRDRFGR